MSQPVSTENAEHYAWGKGCDGWHLLQADGLSIIQEVVPPGSTETMHSHRLSRQFFFIIEGQASMLLDGQEVLLGKGQGLEVAPGARHQFRNRSEADVIFLVVSMPPSHGDRVDS